AAAAAAALSTVTGSVAVMMARSPSDGRPPRFVDLDPAMAPILPVRFPETGQTRRYLVIFL
ncbi:hypothetical protein, partial [Mycolicibacterium peregrinum]|uniref:hypothetical protein n=1 Tax=Mycolicibacterium peregrinum TaxID=43304 RepID=UPI001B8024FE